MKRRGEHEQTISLFSFQDIVCSVIGMVFFVVLIMALDIVDAKGTMVMTGAPSVSEAELESLRGKTDELAAGIRQTESDIKRLIDRLSLASGDERATLDEAKQLEATLKNLYARIQQHQASTAKTDAERQRAAEEYAKKLQEVERLNRRLADLKQALQNAPSAPRLAFIIDPHPDSLEPWLLEVSAKRLRVASKDGTSALLEFGGDLADQRKARFMAWLSTQSNRTHYFVILTKPSGNKLAHELEQDLKARGYEIGVDLLPEEWDPF